MPRRLLSRNHSRQVNGRASKDYVESTSHLVGVCHVHPAVVLLFQCFSFFGCVFVIPFSFTVVGKLVSCESVLCFVFCVFVANLFFCIGLSVSAFLLSQLRIISYHTPFFAFLLQIIFFVSNRSAFQYPLSGVAASYLRPVFDDQVVQRSSFGGGAEAVRLNLRTPAKARTLFISVSGTTVECHVM